MIVILKIITGEEIIGKMECEDDSDFNKLDMYEVFEPMWIVPGTEGAMKLRDALMLSDSLSLIFNPNDIITCYKPTQSLTSYYQRAYQYSQEFTRININSQIDLATSELNEMMYEEQQTASKFTEMLMRISGSKLH